ncbi:MAG: hypothetical protein V2I36_16730 [Desulfopila sp.]|jgi:hypothetical protein|nr:hypothetical protein [Desulfopila sp.]
MRKPMGKLLVQSILVVISASLFFCTIGWAETVFDSDFNEQSWGALSPGSAWALMASGGVDNTPAIRVEFVSTNGPNKTAPHSLRLDLDAYAEDHYFVEFDTKIGGTMHGGMKFIKFFGSSSLDSQNNMTFAFHYTGNVMRQMGFYRDSLCAYRFTITPYEGWDEACQGAKFPVIGNDIDIRGGDWHHFKLEVSRADEGRQNGYIKIWHNDVLTVHITDMPSNPSGSTTPDRFEHMVFGDYTDEYLPGEESWYFWIDNLYVGTTEKTAGPDIAPPRMTAPEPSGTLPMGTTETTIRIKATDSAGVVGCRYDTEDMDYENMSGSFVSVSDNSWESDVTGLSDGSSPAYYARCIDALGNASSESLAIVFTIAAGKELLLYLPAVLVPRHREMTEF